MRKSGNSVARGSAACAADNSCLIAIALTSKYNYAIRLSLFGSLSSTANVDADNNGKRRQLVRFILSFCRAVRGASVIFPSGQDAFLNSPLSGSKTYLLLVILVGSLARFFSFRKSSYRRRPPTS
jgi:hypothetical protein